MRSTSPEFQSDTHIFELSETQIEKEREESY